MDGYIIPKFVYDRKEVKNPNKQQNLLKYCISFIQKFSET